MMNNVEAPLRFIKTIDLVQTLVRWGVIYFLADALIRRAFLVLSLKL